MGRPNSGYSNEMNSVRGRLRELGLPENLFDADFAEQYEAAKERHARLSKRFDELAEKEDLSALKADWKAAEEWLCLVQGPRPQWVKGMKEVYRYWRRDGMSVGSIAKRVARTGRKCYVGSKASNRLTQAGYDQDKLIELGVERWQEARIKR